MKGFVEGLALFLLVGVIVGFPSPKISYFENKPLPSPLAEQIRPGEAFTFPVVPGVESIEYAGLPLSIVNEGRSWLAMASVYDGKKAILSGTWRDPGKNILDRLFGSPQAYFREVIPIQAFTLKQAKELRLPASVWNKMQNADQKKQDVERKTMRAILTSGTPELLNQSCWRLPLDSQVTSLFGSPRTLPNGQQYHHSGLDLRARSPQPIYAMGEGRVAYAGRMVVPGNLVVVDHGAYLHSRYLHMSRIMVEEGQTVSANTLLGFTGSTGRITGPHLHWELLWHGRSGNPLSIFDTWSKFRECEVESRHVFRTYKTAAKKLNSILFTSENAESESR